jgi:hypothetical protein
MNFNVQYSKRLVELIVAEDGLYRLRLEMRNTNNTHFNTYFSTHSLSLVKIYTCPTKTYGSHRYLVGSMWILTNQKECIQKYVLKYVLLPFIAWHLLSFIQEQQCCLIYVSFDLFVWNMVPLDNYSNCSIKGIDT